MRVIILAAGIGTRLRDICKDKPKPLFEIKNKSLLEYSLDVLTKEDLDIIIIIGYKGEKIKEKIGGEYNKTNITYAKNKQYENTGSMHSLYCAFPNKNLENSLILDADIIYHPKIISKLLNYEKKDAVFLTKSVNEKEETFVALNKQKRIKYSRFKEEVFEFNGISKFSKEFLLEMFKLHEKKMKTDTSGDYEECAFEINKTIMPLYGLVDKVLPLVEIDKKEDIENAEKILETIFSSKT